MPVPKRWHPISRDLNQDPECWELTTLHGDRALRIWLEILAGTDKTENQIPLSPLWISSLGQVTRTNLKTVAHVVLWMLDRGWIVIQGDQPTVNQWIQSLRQLCGDWPKTHRRLAGDLPETHRRLAGEWAENGRRLFLGTANYWKYHKRRELSEAVDGSPPILTDPTLTNKKKIQEEDIPASAMPRVERSQQVGVDAKAPAISGATWDSYSQAYSLRYGTEPVRNKKVNSELKKLVELLGHTEAPSVAAFYLSCSQPLYVSARHPTNLLIRDATGLRTQWFTGVRATTAEAKSAEKASSIDEQFRRVTGRTTQQIINVTPITKGVLPHGNNRNTDDAVESG